MLTALPGIAIVCAGMVLLLASGDGGAALIAAMACLIAGVLLDVLGMCRYAQAVRAGRAFRGDRVFLRP
jgi:hypothetical protein